MKPLFFETIKVRNGVPCNLALHHARMARTLRVFYPGADRPELSRLQVPSEYAQGLFRCRMTYSSRIISVDYERYEKKIIRTLGLVEDPDACYPWKSCDRTDLSRLLSSSGLDEIIITRHGFVTDTSFSNLVFENSAGLFTPATFLLNGTKRQELLAKRLIRERKIRIEDLDQYDRLYLINAMLDLGEGHCFALHPSGPPGQPPVFVAVNPEDQGAKACSAIPGRA